MSTPDPIENQDPRRQKVVDHVLRFAEVLQGLSQRFKGVARNLTLSGLAAALVLDLVMRNAWAWSPTVSLIVGVFLALPALVVGWGWYVLEEATGLPERLVHWFGGAKSYAGTVVQRVQGEQTGEVPSRLSDLKALGGLAFEITSLGLDTTGLLSILGGALSVTNPIYLLVLGIAVGLIVLLDISAVIAGLAALF
jgi:hypothetical protein